MAHVGESPLAVKAYQNEKRVRELNVKIMDFIQQRINETQNGKIVAEGTYVNMAHFNVLPGSVLNFYLNNMACYSTFALIEPCVWIIDTGATNHKCTSLNYITKPIPIDRIRPIYLLDG